MLFVVTEQLANIMGLQVVMVAKVFSGEVSERVMCIHAVLAEIVWWTKTKETNAGIVGSKNVFELE